MALEKSSIPGFVQVLWITPDDRDAAINRFQDLWLSIVSPGNVVVGNMTTQEVALASANQRMLFVGNAVQWVMHA